MARRMTAQQQKFAEGYLASSNGYRSALAAGYSESVANNAYQILKKPQVAEYVKKRQAELARECVDVERVLRELASIAFSDAGDYVEVEDGQVRVRDTKALGAEKRAAIALVKEGTRGVELRLHDKLRALEILGKSAGMFSEREKQEEREKVFEVELRVVGDSE